MDYPSGVKTRKVSFGGSVSLEAGELLIVRATTMSNRGLIRVGDGYRFDSLAVEYAAEAAGEEVVFELPVTDQSGWLDAETRQAIIISPGQASHLYTTSLEVARPGGGKVRSYLIGPYAVPDEPGVLDGDLINPDM